MGNADGVPTPDPPVHFYVVSGLVVASLVGTQLLTLFLTGFKKPVPVRSGFEPARGVWMRAAED